MLDDFFELKKNLDDFQSKASVLLEPLPDSHPEDRTAENSEEIAELLKAMQEASAEESRKQERRHRQVFWLTVAVLVVTVIGVLLQLR